MERFLFIGIIITLVAAGYFLLLRLQRKLIEQRLEEMNRIKEDNKSILNTNRAVCERNKHLLSQLEIGNFQVKESVVWMYDHYRDLLLVLSQIQPDDYQSLDRAANTTKMGMDLIAQNFYQTFGMTPEQYRQQKVKMTYTNQSGRSYLAPNAGVN